MRLVSFRCIFILPIDDVVPYRTFNCTFDRGKPVSMVRSIAKRATWGLS